MSLENHPNFHAVKFATDIIASFYRSLRIPHEQVGKDTQEAIRDNIVDFVYLIEHLVDKTQENKVSKITGE